MPGVRARIASASRSLNRTVARHTGYQVRRAGLPRDFDPPARRIIERVQPFTLTDPEKVFCFVSAVRYAHQRRVAGAIVECGVWRGGSMMAAALALGDAGSRDRDLYLFDTFDGMTAPEPVDVDAWGTSAASRLVGADAPKVAASVPLDDVRRSLSEIDYPPERVHFVEGPVERTLPHRSPDAIAVLRLDTDWYSSTSCELRHLYPRLSSGGVLIVDDYGYWRGARQATDEFLATLATPPFPVRVSDSRVMVKP